MHILVYYVPESHLETTKQALFQAGAGKFKKYDQCAWQTLGQGQFRPLEGSNPSTGQINKLEKIPEYKVEILVPQDNIAAIKAALIQSHPYEEPAYHFIPITI